VVVVQNVKFSPFRVQRKLYCHIKQYEVGTLAVDGWAVTFGSLQRGGDWAGFNMPVKELRKESAKDSQEKFIDTLNCRLNDS